MTGGPLSPDENPLFSRPESIPVVYWERLTRDRFELTFLGFPCSVDRSARKISIPGFPGMMNFQLYLVVLSYCAATVRALTDEWVLAKELKGGMHFFDASHPLTVDRVLAGYGGDPSGLESAFRRLGGTPIPFGDVGGELPVLPGITLRYIYWEGDEELPPNLTVNFPRGIEHILALDVIWAMVNVVNGALTALRNDHSAF